VSAGRGHLILFFLLLPVLLAGCLGAGVPDETSDSTWTGAAGQVLDRHGKPAAGAWVYAYASNRGGLRGPADFAARVDPDGRYELDLPPGRFWLVARWRESGRPDTGPPLKGDAWSPWRHNPLKVIAGRVARVDFVLMPVVQPNLLRRGSLGGGDTGFAGVLVDRQGRPVVGAFALAYRGGQRHSMPDFTSAPSLEDGRFRLFVDKGGTWCLAARTGSRGQPKPGELYGVWRGGKAGCVELAEGSLLDIGTIELRPFRASY